MATKPDYNLVLTESDGKYSKVGCGWKNKSGSISIWLNPYVVLPHERTIKLALYPKEYIPRAEQEQNQGEPNASK